MSTPEIIATIYAAGLVGTGAYMTVHEIHHPLPTGRRWDFVAVFTALWPLGWLAVAWVWIEEAKL